MTTCAVLGNQTFITKSDEYIENPPRFKKDMYDYQKCEMQAVLDLEAKRLMYVTTPDANIIKETFGDLSLTPLVATTNACSLSSPFGSGKTIIALSIIASRRMPQAIVETNNTIIGDRYYRHRWERPYGDGQLSNAGFDTEITRKYKQILGVSIIVVGTQVLRQWLQEIKDFTDFKVFVIDSYHTLKQFVDMFKSGSINSYDIVLIKNGTFSGSIESDGEFISDNSTQYPILNAVGKILRGVACAWLIYDDFDTIRISAETKSLNGLFTIYISASDNKAAEKAYKNRRIAKSMSEFLETNMTPSIVSTVNDKVLRTNFNIRSHGSFIEESTKLPKFAAFVCKYINPDDKYIGLIGALGPDGAELAEGLNADALGFVANAVGISTDPSPFAIFRKLLDNEFEKYEHDCLVIDACGCVGQLYENLSADLEPKKTAMSVAEQEKLRTSIINVAKKWKNSKVRTVTTDDITFEWSHDGITNIIAGTLTEFQGKKKVDGRSIDNIKANLKQGECAVCCLELEDIVIARCCTITVCGICTKGSFQLRRKTDKDSKETIAGKCPNCGKNVDMVKDLIYVTRGIDLNAIASSTGTEVQEEVIKAPVVEVVAPVDDYQTKHPKLRALRDIIRGVKPEGAAPTPYKVKNLIEGRDVVSLPKNAPRKILIFAGFNETLVMINDYLEKLGVSIIRLGGTSKEIATQVKKFDTATVTTCMLINSNQICAGLNLQQATDVVFMHRITNQSIESQVAGRGQRVGRTVSMQLWFILYNNESI